MYKIGHFLILITVLIPISVDYVIQGGLTAGWISLFADDAAQAVLIYRGLMLLLQIGTFTGCVLFFRNYVTGANRELMVLMGTALYMLSPIRLYACYDLTDFAVTFFLMGIPFAGWMILKARLQWAQKKVEGAVGYFMVSILCLSAAVMAVMMEPVKPEMEILCERYYLNDMFSAFIYRTAHPGWGLGLMLAAGLYGWKSFVENDRVRKGEIVLLTLTLLSMLAAGCNQNVVYGPLLAMSVGTDCVILLVTGRDYITADDGEGQKSRLWIYGIIAACLAVGTYFCNQLMYYRIPLN